MSEEEGLQSLDDVLNGTEEVTEEVVEDVTEDASTDEPVAEETETTEETQQATDEKEHGTSSVSEQDTSAEVLAGMKAELARIRQQKRDLERQVQEQAKKPEPEQNFFDDPDAALSNLRQTVQTEVQKARIDMSEEIARSRHDDYDEKIAAFQDMAQENPVLWAEMSRQSNPAEWAYKQAAQKMELAEIGDLASYKERLIAEAKAEAKAELEKQMADKIEAEIQKRTGLPRSLSDARSVSGKDVAADDDDLESILGR